MIQRVATFDDCMLPIGHHARESPVIPSLHGKYNLVPLHVKDSRCTRLAVLVDKLELIYSAHRRVAPGPKSYLLVGSSRSFLHVSLHWICSLGVARICVLRGDAIAWLHCTETESNALQGRRRRRGIRKPKQRPERLSPEKAVARARATEDERSKC